MGDTCETQQYIAVKDEIKLSLDSKEKSIDGKEIRLSKKEYEKIREMLKHLSKEELKCIRDYIKEYKNIKDEAKIKLNQLVEENEKLNDLSYGLKGIKEGLEKTEGSDFMKRFFEGAALESFEEGLDTMTVLGLSKNGGLFENELKNQKETFRLVMLNKIMISMNVKSGVGYMGDKIGTQLNGTLKEIEMLFGSNNKGEKPIVDNENKNIESLGKILTGLQKIFNDKDENGKIKEKYKKEKEGFSRRIFEFFLYLTKDYFKYADKLFSLAKKKNKIDDNFKKIVDNPVILSEILKTGKYKKDGIDIDIVSENEEDQKLICNGKNDLDKAKEYFMKEIVENTSNTGNKVDILRGQASKIGYFFDKLGFDKKELLDFKEDLKSILIIGELLSSIFGFFLGKDIFDILEATESNKEIKESVKNFGEYIEISKKNKNNHLPFEPEKGLYGGGLLGLIKGATSKAANIVTDKQEGLEKEKRDDSKQVKSFLRTVQEAEKTLNGGTKVTPSIIIDKEKDGKVIFWQKIFGEPVEGEKEIYTYTRKAVKSINPNEIPISQKDFMIKLGKIIIDIKKPENKKAEKENNPQGSKQINEVPKTFIETLTLNGLMKKYIPILTSLQTFANIKLDETNGNNAIKFLQNVETQDGGKDVINEKDFWKNIDSSKPISGENKLYADIRKSIKGIKKPKFTPEYFVSLSKIEIKKGKEREQKIDTYNITSTRQEFISNIEKTTDNKYLPLVFKLETLKLNKEFEGSTPLSNSEILNVIEFFKNVENYVDNSILRDEKFVSLVFSDKQEKGIKPLYASIRKLVESIKYPKFSNQYFEELGKIEVKEIQQKLRDALILKLKNEGKPDFIINKAIELEKVLKEKDLRNIISFLVNVKTFETAQNKNIEVTPSIVSDKDFWKLVLEDTPTPKKNPLYVDIKESIKGIKITKEDNFVALSNVEIKQKIEKKEPPKLSLEKMLKNTTNVTKDKIILADSTIIAIDREKNMITHGGKTYKIKKVNNSSNKLVLKATVPKIFKALDFKKIYDAGTKTKNEFIKNIVELKNKRSTIFKVTKKGSPVKSFEIGLFEPKAKK